MQALEELVTRWRRNPDPEATLALCAHLGTAPAQSELMREVGNTAEAWHRDNHTVMLSVGVMFLDAGLLAEAQASMVHAAKLEPSGGDAYRCLGEVLLRRGDAARGEKVLAKAIALGCSDAQTRLWHERAIVYMALQQRRGAAAVADEIARTAPRTPMAEAPVSSEDPQPRAPRARAEMRRSRPPPAAGRPSPPRRSSPPSAARRQSAARPQVTPRQATLLMGQATAPVLPTGVSLAPVDQQAAEPVSSGRVATAGQVAAQDAEQWEPAPQEPPEDSQEDVRPDPDTVLAHLARVGLFEPESGVRPIWEAAPRKLPRRFWVLAGAVVSATVLGIAGYGYARQVQAQRAAEALEIEAKLADLLRSGRPAALEGTEDSFRRLFDLDSRGKAAARLWLTDRVLHALLGDSAQGLESAIRRARGVGVDESEIVFGSLASAIAEGDTAGAARLIERWDERAKADPYYQLLAGVVFERAGDEQALERFKRALALDGTLKLAHMMAAGLAVIELEPAQAAPILNAAYAALGDGPSMRALQGLAWAAGATPAEPPPAALGAAERAALAPPLRAAEIAVRAVDLARMGKRAEAKSGFHEAIELTTSPAMATWIGYRVLDAGYPSVARSAGLKAMQLSALYPGAQALATRVALSEGRLADAERAAANLGPMAQEPLLIRVAAAYESLESAELGRQLASLPSGFEASPTLGALGQAAKVLSGKGLKRAVLDGLANERQIWGPLIALDSALDAGSLKLAESIIAARTWEPPSPAQALRLSRLARYQGDMKRALEVAEPLLEAAGSNRRYLAESVLLLLDVGRLDAMAGLLEQRAAGAGELAPWLNALADAARGEVAAGAARIARIPPPAADSGVPVEVVALRAMVAAKDKRARAYLKALAQRLPRHPDVQRAARAL